MATKKPNGVILWQGPSRINGVNVVLIATGLRRVSRNAKTGPMIQTWILVDEVNPSAAQQMGADDAVCGDCPARPALGGHCYVRTSDAPLSIWRAYKRGEYPVATDADWDALKARRVRAGSYGDPYAVPTAIWRLINPWTGYTHQWQRGDAQPLAQWLMASCDDVADRETARDLGWRTFRVREKGAPLMPREIECASDSVGRSCFDCGLCKGKTLEGAKDIAIQVHGATGGRFGGSVSPLLRQFAG